MRVIGDRPAEPADKPFGTSERAREFAKGGQEPKVGMENIPDDEELRGVLVGMMGEINDAFSNGSVSAEMVAEWLNRGMSASLAYFGKTCVGAPIGRDGKPILPGELVRRGDGELFRVVAVDGIGNAYYDLSGGSIPTSVTVGLELEHAEFQDAGELLDWYLEAASHGDADAAKEAALEALGRL